MKVIAVANQKGGVGKTTVTRELSACCALRGYQTLVIDCDPQANLTASWVDPDVYNITLQTTTSCSWIALRSSASSSPPLSTQLIMCWFPALPTQWGLQGLADLAYTIQQVRNNVNSDLKMLGAVVNLSKPQRNLAAESRAAVEAAIALVHHVFDTNLHDYSKIAEAPSQKLPAVMYARLERGRTARSVGADGNESQGRPAVLSACDTARGRVRNGEGMIGMTWALFVAGVPTVIASQWEVPSESTTNLMLGLHKGLATNGSRTSKAEAWRGAALTMIRDPRYRTKPYYWAGFVVVGDGGR